MRPRRLCSLASLCLLVALTPAGSAAPLATPFGCHPHPGLGSVALVRGAAVHVIDFATCSERVLHERAPNGVVLAPDGSVSPLPPASRTLRAPGGGFVATVRATGSGRNLRNTIVVTSSAGTSRSVYSAPVIGDTTSLESRGPIWLLRWSGDARWIFFMIDSGGSSSIAADGLILRAVARTGGPVHVLATMLPYGDYLTWCGGRLVSTAGRDRIAIHAKRLLEAGPRRWQPGAAAAAPGRSFGSLACDPSDNSVVAQAQPSSTNAGFFATHWALWRIDLAGHEERLTSPPAGYADESPRFSRTGGTLLFVRSRHGAGKLYALEGRRVVGPLLALGSSLGYYGHQDWWATMAWSLAAP